MRVALAIALIFGSVAAGASTAPPQIDQELRDAIRTAPKSTDWPNQNAVRLLDLSDITVRPDGTMVERDRETFKLFNKNARDLAEVNLPYNTTYQEIRFTGAQTVRPDGTVAAVKVDDLRETAPFADYLMYDDARALSFSMPAVEDNCVIDYRFVRVTRPLLMPGQFWLRWFFNAPMPVTLSRLVLHVPTSLSFRFRDYNCGGLQPIIATSADGHTRTYTWEMSALKPLAIEPAMPALSDVRARLDLTSIPDWQSVSRWFAGLAAPQTAPSAPIRATVSRITAGLTTPADKTRAIYDWVCGKTRYVGLEFGLSAYKPHAAAQVFENLYGDCKDKTTLLISMLAVAGIRAYPALLQAGDRHDSSADLPTLNSFDHCIALARVDNREVWLDPTAETCAYGDIPGPDRGSHAFVDRDGKGEFLAIPPYTPEQNGTAARVGVALKPDGSAALDMQLSLQGTYAQSIRLAISRLDPEKRQLAARGIADAVAPGSTIVSWSMPDGRASDSDCTIKLVLTAPAYAKKAGKLLLVPLAHTGGSDDTSPFTSDHRTWPIEIDTESHLQTVMKLTVPDGYAVDDLPAPLHLSYPLQDVVREVTQSPDGKTVTVSVTLNQHAGSVPPDHYAEVQKFFNALVATINDTIVLRATH